MKLDKNLKVLRQKRRWRLRKKVIGSPERPRLVVTFSNQNIYAQCIDDAAGKTLVYLSTNGKELREQNLKANVESATKLGQLIAERAKGANIEQVVFDRAGRRYHGTVKAFAEAAREAGLQF